MVFKAVGEHVYVQVLKEDHSKTSSGLYVAQNTSPPQSTGIVVSVGEKVTNIKEGDKVAFFIRGGQVIQWYTGDHDYRVLKENEVYGIIKED